MSHTETSGEGEGRRDRELGIRRCDPEEREEILEVINEAAVAYRGVIPEDRWKEPYMPAGELARELDEGVVFRGARAGGRLVGVMGIQRVEDVELIRHAYVLPDWQGRGVGTRLLEDLRARSTRPLLVGTWAAAEWAVAFYEARGFRRIPGEKGARVLRRYWSIPERQVETSVVLADERWWER